MTKPIPGGRRRIDRVLAADYLDDLETRPVTELRDLRLEAAQEEADLSYIRRLVHGRIDIVEAELAHRRDPEAGGRVIDRLGTILADQRTPSQGMGRHFTVEPSRLDERRRRVEQIVADVDISDVEARTTDELTHASAVLRAFEQEVSQSRRSVQHVVDALSAELGVRYGDGRATTGDILPGRGRDSRA